MLVAHEQNSGLGAGFNAGLRHFHKNGKPGDLGLIMDADNTHEPRYVHSMLKK
ncbi:glycosyltransferase [endosymbiont 'TC1' of Trimyema compressum]|uniref:glycosyltransferase n=1 Tax=endosymbiont 'TC1' of Trimyema compressum TaxID=243899 RepID=UPI003CCBAA41